MIRLQQIVKNYPDKSKVIDQVNLEINKGEYLYVLGGTGAGKSTLLKLIALEEETSSGELSLFGYEMSKAKESTRLAIRQAVGYIPQNTQLISDFTVYENVALSLTYGGARVVKADTRKWIHEILERLNLQHLKDSLGGKLSGGETQRVSMARALVRRPELIIADEPTGNQDQQNTWALMDLFQRANMNGTTILIATHDQEIIRRVPKRCAFLKSGKLHMEENQRAYSQISP